MNKLFEEFDGVSNFINININEWRFNMKKIYTLFLMLFLLIGTLGIVAADEDTGEEVNIPEAQKVGFFGNAFSRINLAFTFP